MLTGDRDRCLSLARVMSAQMGVNAWAELVTVTMLGFGQELMRDRTRPAAVRTRWTQPVPSWPRRPVPRHQTADSPRAGSAWPWSKPAALAASDEAWRVHVLLATTAAADVGHSRPTASTSRPAVLTVPVIGSRLAELLEVVHERAGATGAAVVVVTNSGSPTTPPPSPAPPSRTWTPPAP